MLHPKIIVPRQVGCQMQRKIEGISEKYSTGWDLKIERLLHSWGHMYGQLLL
jgi:hypothetical protein